MGVEEMTLGLRRLMERTLRRRPLDRLASFTFPSSVRGTWKEVRRRHLTYLTEEQLQSLLGLCQEMERRKEDGTIIEAGCARGGSAILLCAVKSRHRPLRVYDVFGELPPPSEEDGPDLRRRYEEISSGRATGPGGLRHYSYETDLYQQVERAFTELGHPVETHTVSLVRGKVQDTLEVSGPVCLAHIDVDWYEPVAVCLERIVPALVVRGAVVVHAYNNWSGARSATDQYFKRVGRGAYSFDNSPGHLVIRRRY
jgi:O-methyltransferase